MFEFFYSRKLANLKHQHDLALAEITESVKRDRATWEEDKARQIADLKSKHDITVREVISLTKLESEQRIKKAEINSDAAVAKVKADADSKLNDKIAKLTASC